MQLDILAIGPHPDDVEIGIGGTLIKHADMGYKCGIVDLTAGETGTNGTPEIRKQEALKAAEVMGMMTRDCLGLPDARLAVTEEMLRPIIEIIRRYQPKIVIGPYSKDRHPDHLRAHQLVREAAHLAGLHKYPAAGEAHRPPVVLQFLLGAYSDPSIVVDITPYYERKMEAICAHASQFALRADIEVQTYVNDPAFMRGIRARDQFVGSLIQVPYAEGIVMDEHVEINDLMSLPGRQRMSHNRNRR
ncbi:MAG: bacillithiol biosynthesis deacetylase BshB1 [Firmicutes bacterium]|nr:bacillithiol biosynthesis deacetylase BshB1 [Bacillota bacterium]